MSKSRSIASHSPLPSSSLLKSHQRHSRSLLPSPAFGLPHIRSGANDEAIEASAVAEESTIAEEVSTDFQPFFTLIENPSTSEHHHPAVHYIFADDDAEIITEAACRALAQDDHQHRRIPEEDGDKLPPAVNGVREHYILLDVQPQKAGSGYEVLKAHSMSSAWQVLNASISNAPTIEGTITEPGEGLMLKIEGIGAAPQTESQEASKGRESLQHMVERFERGLAEMRKLVDEGQD